MLAVVLIALGLAMLARALPRAVLLRLLGDPRVVAGVLVLTTAAAVAAVASRGQSADAPRTARPEQRGVCADAALQPVCADLVQAAQPALDVLARLPLDAGATRGEVQLIQPGRGDVYLTQSVVTTAPPADASAQVAAALEGVGWSRLADPGALLRLRRGSLVAVVRVEPAGAGARVQLVVTRG